MNRHEVSALHADLDFLGRHREGPATVQVQGAHRPIFELNAYSICILAFREREDLLGIPKKVRDQVDAVDAKVQKK